MFNWRAPWLRRKQAKQAEQQEAEAERAEQAERAEPEGAEPGAAEAEGEEAEPRHAESEQQGWASEGRAQRWSRAELKVINEVAMAEERGWVPADAALPTAERLVERGVLRRSMFGDTPVYSATPSFRQKAALFLHRGEAARQAAEN